MGGYVQSYNHVIKQNLKFEVVLFNDVNNIEWAQ